MKTNLKITKLRHEFVEFIPKQLEEGVLYVSINYATASHRCCCGCGAEIVTPITPTDWKLIFNGPSVSLTPSVGNWSLPCKSHYWITENKVDWASRWSWTRIESGRTQDKIAKDEFYDNLNSHRIIDVEQPKQPRSWFSKLKPRKKSNSKKKKR